MGSPSPAQLPVVIALLALFTPAQTPAPVRAPQATPRVIHITALDAGQTPVPDLAAADIVVKEDGRPREVAAVERASGPLHIVILVDDNGTGIFRYGLAAFAQRLQGKATIAIRVVTNQVQTLVDRSSDVGAWLAGIDRLGARPATPEGGQLLEGIFEAAREFRRLEAARSTILALTVGGDEQSPRLAGQVLDELTRSGAALHVVVVDSPAVRPSRAIGKPGDLLEDNFNLSRVLSDGPKLSGGRRRDVLAAGFLQVEVQQVARDLLSQFAVTYLRPGSGGTPRRLEVMSRRPGITVMAPTRLPDR